MSGKINVGFFGTGDDGVTLMDGSTLLTLNLKPLLCGPALIDLLPLDPGGLEISTDEFYPVPNELNDLPVTIGTSVPPAEVGGPVSTSSTVACESAATEPMTLPVVKDQCGTMLSPQTGDPVVGGTYAGCEGTRTYTYKDCLDRELE